jgi:hypothetical protein
VSSFEAWFGGPFLDYLPLYLFLNACTPSSCGRKAGPQRSPITDLTCSRLQVVLILGISEDTSM